MEALTIIAIGVAWLLIFAGMGWATRERPPTREISKEEALFFYKQGFYKQGFEYAWKRYQELFKKGE